MKPVMILFQLLARISSIDFINSNFDLLSKPEPPSASAIFNFTSSARSTGKVCIKAFKRVLDKSSKEGGTFSLNDNSNHWFNCWRRRSSDKPMARIPRARQADCSSLTDKFSTPSLKIN
uniref:Secreted protein n=1 Tax=Romanomermis culicivorax TaxID=13658 RepID=A0A915JHM7_ROMCU